MAKQTSEERRKLIAFDRATWLALDQLARDSMMSVQELADEAFTDLLRKHNRPTNLKDALRRSVRLVPANDSKSSDSKSKARRTK